MPGAVDPMILGAQILNVQDSFREIPKEDSFSWVMRTDLGSKGKLEPPHQRHPQRSWLQSPSRSQLLSRILDSEQDWLVQAGACLSGH